MTNSLLRVVVLASGFGSNLQVIINHAKEGKLSAEVIAVVSDKKQSFALERARKENIKAVFVNSQKFADRGKFDVALRQEIDSLNPNLIVLAGYMRILTAAFVDHFKNRIMNIHPSLLPKYKGTHTHEQVLLHGDSVHGATVHFVTAELDAGPIIIQQSFEVRPTDTVDDLEERVHQCEYEIYSRAIQWFADGEIRVENGKVLRTGSNESH